MRFFDVELRLVAWFDGLDAGGVTSVSFVATGAVANVEANDARDARDEPTKNAQLEKRPTTFAAPDFVVATNDSFVFALRSGDFNAFGSDEAVARASLVSRGATEPAVALAAHPTDPVLCVAGLHGGVWTWNYATHSVVTHVDLTRGGVKPQSKPTCVAYRTDGLGVVVGTRGGELKALDAETLAETQAMRFTPDAVTRVCSNPARVRGGGDAGASPVPPARAYPRAAGRRGPRARLRLRGQAPDARRGDALRGPRLRLLGRRRVRRAGVRWRRGPRRALRRRGKHRRGRRGRARGERRRARGRGGGGGRATHRRGVCQKNAPRKKDARVEPIESVARRFAVASVADVGRRLRVRLRLRVRVGLGRAARTHAAGRGRPPEAAPGGLRDADGPGEVRAPYGTRRRSWRPSGKRGLLAYVRARRRGVGRLPADGDPPIDGRRRAPGAGLALAVSEVVVDGGDATRRRAPSRSAWRRRRRRRRRRGPSSVWRVDAAAARQAAERYGTFSKTRDSRFEDVAARRRRLLEGAGYARWRGGA